MYEDEISMLVKYYGCIAGVAGNAVIYIEKVIKSRSLKLLARSKAISLLGGNSEIDLEDIEFVLRKDKNIVKQIKTAKQIKKIQSIYNCELALSYSVGDNLEISSPNESLKERLRILDCITKQMDIEEYDDYIKSREYSFTYKKCDKFKRFLGIKKLSVSCVETLGLVARDLLFKIVQIGIKFRNEKHTRKENLNSYTLDSDRSPLSLNEVEESTRRVYFSLQYKV